jgi:hypothetical protein
MFDGLSAPEPEKLGKRQIVLDLLPSIEGMKQKGFTLAGIAQKFTEQGIPLTVPALKSILSHAEPGGAAPKSKKHRKRKAQAAGSPGVATESPAPLADPTASSEGSGKAATPGMDGLKGTAEEPKRETKPVGSSEKEPTPSEKAEEPAPPKEGGPRKGPFTPRKDSGNL